jgi:hypothetical protein
MNIGTDNTGVGNSSRRSVVLLAVVSLCVVPALYGETLTVVDTDYSLAPNRILAGHSWKRIMFCNRKSEMSDQRRISCLENVKAV